MKKSRVILTVTLAALALVAIPFVVHAQAGRGAHAGPFGGHRGGPGMMMHGGGGGEFFGHLVQLKDELELSDAQTDQIKAILREVHEQSATSREQLHTGHIAIAKTLIANPADTAAAQALLDQQLAAERTMKANHLAGMARALTVLTPEQRTKLSGLVDKHFERRMRTRR